MTARLRAKHLRAGHSSYLRDDDDGDDDNSGGGGGDGDDDG